MFLFYIDPASYPIYSLSLHDALPISIDQPAALGPGRAGLGGEQVRAGIGLAHADRSEEHTSELQSRENLVCRLLLEKKKGFHHDWKSYIINYGLKQVRSFLLSSA